MFKFLAEVIVFQLIFLLLYDLFLRKETFFQGNRIYLIGTFILSLILPNIQVESIKTTLPVDAVFFMEFQLNQGAGEISESNTSQEVSMFNLTELIFWTGTMIMLAWLMYKLFNLHQLKRRGKVLEFKEYRKVILPNSELVFSFFRTIFFGERIPENKSSQILEHELVHVRQWHSADLFFFEVLRIPLWFNPMVYIYQNRLAEVHEFIADAHVAHEDRKAHCKLLLSEVFQTQNFSFVNHFFKRSLIKKRIVMLTREKSKTIQQIKYILLLPVFLGMLFYTSCEKEGEMYKDEMMAVTLEDEELIEFSHQKIKQLKALYGSDWYYHRNEIKFANNEEEANGIKSKKAFFTARIANITYLRESQEGSVRNFNNMDREMKVLLPSSSQYEDYIEKYRAFKTLDPNLKVSITNEFTIRPIKKEDKNLGPGEWITVGNLNDLSGEEVLRVNQALESIKGTERYVALSNGTNMSFLVNATDRSGETSFFPFE